MQVLLLFAFPVRLVGSAEPAEFVDLEAIGIVLFVFVGDVVAALALGAGQSDDDAHVGRGLLKLGTRANGQGPLWIHEKRCETKR
jgi:hypothetical protein